MKSGNGRSFCCGSLQRLRREQGESWSWVKIGQCQRRGGLRGGGSGSTQWKEQDWVLKLKERAKAWRRGARAWGGGGWIRGKCQGSARDRRQGRASADGGKAGVKESLFLAHFLSYVFTSITTWGEQLQLVFSLPSVHQFSGQGWQSVWWHSAVLCPALYSPSLSHGKNLAAHSAQQVSSPTPRRPLEQNRTLMKQST